MTFYASCMSASRLNEKMAGAEGAHILMSHRDELRKKLPWQVRKTVVGNEISSVQIHWIPPER